MLKGIIKGVYKSNSIEEFTFKPKINNEYDPKLNTYPFKYLRILTPQDVKEYRLDLFKSMISNKTLTLELVGSINGIPRLTLYPRDYVFDSHGGNYYERVNFENFPQISYSIDSYLAFKSSLRDSIIKSEIVLSSEVFRVSVSSIIGLLFLNPIKISSSPMLIPLSLAISSTSFWLK